MRSPSSRGAETSPESCEPSSEFSSSKCRHQSCSTNYLDNDNDEAKEENSRVLPADI